MLIDWLTDWLRVNSEALSHIYNEVYDNKLHKLKSNNIKVCFSELLQDKPGP